MTVTTIAEDRELLELAAKAAGYEVNVRLMRRRAADAPKAIALALRFPATSWWHPLEDDGDAFRLAARLKLNTAHGTHSVGVSDEDEIEEAAPVLDEAQRTAALRRAIVTAAADIGRTMPKA